MEMLGIPNPCTGVRNYAALWCNMLFPNLVQRHTSEAKMFYDHMTPFLYNKNLCSK